MAKGRRGSRGQGRGRGAYSAGRNARAGARTVVVSGMSAGSNGDLVSQSGGRASTFQATNGSSQNRYGPGSTGRKSIGSGGWVPGWNYAIFGPGGDSAPVKGGRNTAPGVSINTAGNTGKTNVSLVMPKALGPKGFGGNYKLSRGY